MEELQPGRAEEIFRSIAKNDSKELDFEDFKKLIPSKNVYTTDVVSVIRQWILIIVCFI